MQAFLAHFINVYLAVIINSENSGADECIWYFITYSIDSFGGVILVFLQLRLVESMLDMFEASKYKSGNYFEIIMPED